MRFPYEIICFDLEANQPSGKIIEIGAVCITRELTSITGEFQAYVNPDEPVSDYIKNLCGLETASIEKIKEASGLTLVNNDFYQWATQKSKNVVLASWGNYDATALHGQDPICQFRKKSIDIKSIAAWECARLGIKTENSLSATCRALCVPVEQPIHRGLPDAKTTANVLLALANEHRKRARFLNAIYPKEV